MDVCFEAQEPGEIVAFIRDVCKKGVRLWTQHGQLHFKAATGVLTRSELEKLKSSRDQILALLSKPSEETVAPDEGSFRAPLTFPQLAHWRLFRLSDRCISPRITSVLRLRGALHVDLLSKALDYLAGRHDALRTRIVGSDGVPEQEISRVGRFDLHLEDAEVSTGLEVNRVIDRELVEPTHFSRGPLCSATLLKCDALDHVLIITLDHMVSDALSMEILLRELFEAYSQAVQQRQFSLPPVAVQYSDYALWQTGRQDRWLEDHGLYWRARLEGCKRVRFPVGKEPIPQRPIGLSCVNFDLGSSLTDSLREWARVNCTTLPLSVLTAYMAVALRWCSVSEMVVQYQTAGRGDAKLESTIGYFASVLYLRVGMTEQDTFKDLLQRITGEYFRADEHADSSYLASRSMRPDFARNTIFNWVPRGNGPGRKVLENTGSEVEITTVEFVDPALKSLECDHEPAIVLTETEDSIVGGIYYPHDLFGEETMSRLAEDLVNFVKEMTSNSESRISEIELRCRTHGSWGSVASAVG